MNYTYMMEPEKVQNELSKLWDKYQLIINKDNPNWDEINEARSILYLTGNVFCEKIAVEAIERRLHLLKEKLSLIEFFDLIDKNSEKLEELRKDELFVKLEKFYNIIKKYKNNYTGGKYYLEEEKFIKKYNNLNPEKEHKIGYKGSF
ncbi:MAG: hypothetical protein KJ623_00610 [Nanoarchaeota archaeon]|nr:hypothetical protein [Nanoarchaeota archaeon]